MKQAVAAPVIPEVAWRRPMGLPCPEAGHPRVGGPMTDDGSFAGIPIGGLGTGSIGRTHRGDFARWHLEVGRHVYQPVAADGFSVYLGRPGETGTATVLSALRPDELTEWGWTLPVGGGTYHALFPRAWQTFEPDVVGVRLTGEQLSPVIADDPTSSALPVGVFEWWVENPTAEPLTVGLMLTWADPQADPSGVAPGGAWHESAATHDVDGVILHAPVGAAPGLRGTFALAASREPGVTITTRSRFDAVADTELWDDFAADGRLEPADDRRASDDGEPIGAAVAATVELAPGERRSIRFAVAWDLPVVEFGAGRRWWKRYTRDWGRTGDRAFDLACHALERTPAWRAAIEAWQRPVLESTDRPDWYKAALFNELYFLVDGGSFWEAGEVGGPAPDPDDAGRFALLECTDYPFYDSVDVDFYASFAILRLFPGLEMRGIRDLLASVPVDDPEVVTIEATGLPAPRKVGGTVPHDIGGPADDPFYRPNWYKFQDVHDWKDLTPKVVLQVWRDAVAAAGGEGDGRPDVALIRESWPTLDGLMTRLSARDRDDDGLPEHDGFPDQTYDTWPMHGPSAYGGSLWLGALAAMERIAGELGDAEAAQRWSGWFERGQVAFDRRLWRHDHYAYDDGGAASSDSVMADQLAGQWYADATGLGDLLPADRVEAALRTIHRLNVRSFAGGRMGAVNGMRPDGTVDHSSEQSAEVWVGTTYALAAFMLGRGLVDEGWDTARGAAAVTYERGLWFRTPEAYDEAGNFRASLYVRPLAIWAIEEALERRTRSGA